MDIAPLPYAAALAQVKAQVAASRTSFHAGMAILPKARREAMYGLYGFCRAVDDIADDSPTPELAAQGLQEWRERVALLFRGEATDAITSVLLPARDAFNLVEKDFIEIIEGMEMDSVAIVAPDYAALDRYCDLVASAVGRASVRIFGDSGDEAMLVSHHLGRALQLTNILRDLREDAARGRLYLPREFLHKHGIVSRVPAEALASPHLPKVCGDLAQKASQHYQQADMFMKKCKASAMRPARIMRCYYGEIFNIMRATGWRLQERRVSLSKGRKIMLLLKGLVG